MEDAKHILAKLYRSKGGGAANQQLVLSCWAGAVGSDIAARTKPIRLIGKRLVVDVEGHEWRRQLAKLAPSIVGKLNAAVGKRILEDIDLRIVPLPKRPPQSAATAVAKPFDEAAGIADPNLRRIYRNSKTRAAKA